MVHLPSQPTKHARHGPRLGHLVNVKEDLVRRDLRVGPLLCARKTSRPDLFIAHFTLYVVASVTYGRTSTASCCCRSFPTKHVEKEMTSLWWMMADEKIPDKLLHTLIARHSHYAEWYGLSKDHKPLRPIILAGDTPCERVSWLIERIPAPTPTIRTKSSLEHTRFHKQAPWHISRRFTITRRTFHHGCVSPQFEHLSR